LPAQLHIQVGDVELTSEDALAKWLNALEYHRDADKRAELKQLFDSFPADAARAIFLTAMIEKAGCVLEMASIVAGIAASGAHEIIVDAT
jgi:hypothetical protein